MDDKAGEGQLLQYTKTCKTQIVYITFWVLFFVVNNYKILMKYME